MHSSVGGNATARNIDEEVTSSETTIMYMSSLLLEMAPGVILALASVLVDAVTTTRPTPTPHRQTGRHDPLLLQVLLLLAATLEHSALHYSRTHNNYNNTNTSTNRMALQQLVSVCIFCTIFLSMASAGLATQITSHRPRSRTHERAYTRMLVLHMRPMLAPCALIPLFYTFSLPIHNNNEGPQHWSMMDATWFVLKLYVAPLATASLIRRYSYSLVPCGCRRTTPAYEINAGSSYPYDVTSTALPMQNDGVTSHYDSAFVREEEWYRWTSSQVVSWLLEQQHQQRDDWPPGTTEELIAQLAGEGVDGSILPSLTVEHVRSFGISFGNAVRLVSQIDRLVQTYPNNNIRHTNNRQSRQTYAGGDDILERDGWWSKPNISTISQQPSSNDTRSTDDTNLEEQQQHDSNVPGPPVNENEERAREIMKDKFGFNLPEMRRPQSSFSQPPLTDDDMMSPEQLTMETAPLPPEMQEIASRRPDLVKRLMELRGSQEQTTSSNRLNEGLAPNNNVASALPTPTPTLNPAMVAAMPPSVRAIALRRPDLVQDLLLLKQSSSPIPPSTPGLVSQLQRNMMKKDPDYASRFVGAQAAMNMPPIEEDSKQKSRSMGEQQSMHDKPSKGYYDNDEVDDDKASLLRRRSHR